MGNSPSEYNGASCVCGKNLPACKSWDDFILEELDRIVDQVEAYIFLGGRYYRIKGFSEYYCPDCFWKPKKDHIEKQNRRKKREEKLKRAKKAKLARKERNLVRQKLIEEQHDKRRKRELQKQKDFERRQQEAKKEAEKKAALRREEEKRAQHRKELKRIAIEKKKTAQFDHRLSEKSLSEKFTAWSLNVNREIEESVQIETYKPFKSSGPSINTSYCSGELYDDSDEILFENEEMDVVSAELASTVVALIENLKPDEELDGKWLKSAQTLLLTYYIQSNGFSPMEADVLFDFLAYVQSGLSNEESLSLAKTLCHLGDIHPLDLSTTFTLDKDVPLLAKVSSLLLQCGRYHHDNSCKWMQKCLTSFVSTMSEDTQLQKMVMEISCKSWSSHKWFKFFQRCFAANLSMSTQKHIVHLIQTYSIKPDIVNDVLKRDSDIVEALKGEIKNEQNKFLVQIFDEIRQTELLDEGHVEKIVTRVYEMLDEKSINIDLGYNDYLHLNLEDTKLIFKRLSEKEQSPSNDELASAIITLMCAVQNVKGFHPRETQLVAFVILLISSKNMVNNLLEVLTGEGKSCVIAMFATVLGIQGKHVDIVTSSPILALRDTEEWAPYYHIFNLSVTHNTDLKDIEEKKVNSEDNTSKESDDNSAKTNERGEENVKGIYENDIVYGTVSNFSADILKEEFEQKPTRSGRRFDAVIVDEVDMLMLDEGVQFTYLSHNAAVLHHMEPVLAAVWAIIGPQRPTMTVSGDVLYASSPKLFTEIIFECLDPETSKVEDPSQVLSTAKSMNVISEEQFKVLNGSDQEEKKKAMSTISVPDVLEFLSQLKEYDNMPKFQAYTVNEDGFLEAANSVTTELAEKILLHENGRASSLNTSAELSERGTKIVKANLQFSDEEGDIQVKLPSFLKVFVMDQVPTYVENAIRALHMAEGREYTISNDAIIPVDFQNSGIMELNKKWGGGLQQMLEMKHSLCISSISLVTNFMSNIDFFSRYKRNGGIYGLSGTLGLDTKATSKVLDEIYDVKVCGIPTFRAKKLYEKPVIMVEEDTMWSKEIVSVANEAFKEEPWRKGRAVLILCEDINTAGALKKHVLETEKWKEEKVHLYAHSNSKELDSIKTKLGPGEVIIATNLAGRGTDIKVTDEVNESGGLLCLLTFLPRNRRVELQAFGRTARSGNPGSVQCIFKASSLPSHYQGLDIDAIRRLREEEEVAWLDQLISSDVKEVQLKEILFKKYCEFLQEIYHQFASRDDASVVVDSLNENWGQWLQMRSDQIENLTEEHKLLLDLARAREKWRPVVPANPSDLVHLPVTNFYHLVKFGNQLLIKQEKENAERACAFYTDSIKMEPRYAAIALYNRAYCTIITASKGYKQKALEDLKEALKCLEPYVNEASSIHQFVSLVSQVRGTTSQSDQVSVENEDPEPGHIESEDLESAQAGEDSAESEDARDFNTQIQARFQILDFIKKKIEEAVKKIEETKDDIEAKPVGIMSLVPGANTTTKMELSSMWTLGMEIVFSVEKKPKFCWSGLICFFLGVVQLTAGVLLTVFTVGTAAEIGMFLIGEGISDCISGIEGMVTGEFSWTEYAISKATGIALSLISGGVSRFATNGIRAFKLGYKIGKELTAIPKIVKTSFGAAARTNLKNATKYAAKEFVMQGVGYAQNKLCDKMFGNIAERIGKKCKENLMESLQSAFSDGYLGTMVDQRYINQLDEKSLSKAEVTQTVQDQAQEFFKRVGDVVVSKLVMSSEVKERLTSASLDLFSRISQKGRKGGKVALVANIAEVAVMEAVALDAVASLSFLIDQFIPETVNVCETFIKEEGIPVSAQTKITHSEFKCAVKLKTDLKEHVGEVFGNAVASLLQVKLGSLMNHAFNRTVGHVTKKTLNKYVIRTDKTTQDIKAGQHANYIRAVGAGGIHSKVANVDMVHHYAEHMANSDNPGSLMDLRIAAEHFGQGVTIYQEKKNGRLTRDCSIDPSNKKQDGNIELVYVPPPDHNSVGHYDVLVEGKRVKVEADNSNCLFHAFACGENPSLTHSDLKQEANRVRQAVAECIHEQPHMWADHIQCRVEMDQLRKGNRFALVGAGGERNVQANIVKGLYHQKVEENKLFTMYREGNGVKHKASQTFDSPLNVENGVITNENARMTHMYAHTEGLSLTENRGKRSDTLPVPGMIERPTDNPNFDPKDSEVAAHASPSRGGACVGTPYANGYMASTKNNTDEMDIWTPTVKNVLADSKFAMTHFNEHTSIFENAFDPNINYDAATREKIMRRLELFNKIDPRACRVKKVTSTIHLPSRVTAAQIKAIKKSITNPRLTVKTNLQKKTITFIMGPDYALCVPKKYSKLRRNGELYKGEITNAKRKVKRHPIGKIPDYDFKPNKPRGFKKISEELQQEFDTFVQDHPMD